MDEEIKIRYEKTMKKLYCAVGEGKVSLMTQNMDLRILKKNLDFAIELEEYKAAQIFHDLIENMKS